MQNTISTQQLQVRQPAGLQGKSGRWLTGQEGEMTDPFLQIIMNLIAQDPELQAGQEILSHTGTNEIAGLLQTQAQGASPLELLSLFQTASLSQATAVQQNRTDTHGEKAQALTLESLEETLAQAVRTAENGDGGTSETAVKAALPETEQILPKTTRQADESNVSNQQPEQSGDAAPTRETLIKVQAVPLSKESPQDTDASEAKSEPGTKAKQTISKQPVREEKAEELDVDTLQSRVSQSKVSSPFELKLKTAEERTEIELKDQISDGIKHNVSLGKSEFILKLKPESLGEITVKLIEEAGKTSVTISTLSAQTAKLINSELHALKLAVAPMNVEVSEAVTQTQQASQSNLQGFDLASQQFAQQQFYQGQFENQGGYGHAAAAGASGVEILSDFAEETYATNTGALPGKKLDAYV